LLASSFFRKDGQSDEDYLKDIGDRMGWEFGDPQDGIAVVDSYHIDSELGLYIFAETLKRHGLV